MNFLDIAKKVRACVNQASDDGELMEHLEKSLDTVEGEFEAKHDAIRAVMNGLEGRIERRKAEAKRIADLAKRDEATHERLCKWLMLGMRAAGVRRIETDDFVTAIVKNGGKPSVKFEGDISELPILWTKTKIETVLDRDFILDAFEKGLPLPAGVKVERGERLQLK